MMRRMASSPWRKWRCIGRAGHPGWRRCSSLKYWPHSRSSRLASRAPRPSRCDAARPPRTASAARRARPVLALVAPLAFALALAGCAARTAPATTAGVRPTAATAATAGAPTTAPNVVSIAAFGRGRLAPELDPYFGTPPLAIAVWSVLVQSLDSGEVLYRLNPDTLVMPASNQKIVTTAVAASRLGWDFRFETRLETTAPIDHGVLKGDLVVAGNGDPTINAREQRATSVFDELATALKAAGVTRVEGRLVGDDDAFEDERFGAGWQWDDAVFAYSAPFGPLQVHMNAVDVVVAPGAAERAPAVVTIEPAASDLVVLNRAVTGAAGSEPHVSTARYPARRELLVAGSVPLGGRPVTRAAAIDNPTQYFVNVLKQALESRGIVITGEAMDIDDAAATAVPSAAVPSPTTGAAAVALPRPGRTVLARAVSPPLSEIAKTLMKASQNLYAETVMRAISLSPGPATMAASAKAVEETLARWGVAPRTYVVADGSGLSRYNYVSASMIAAILKAMARDPKLYEPFLATMPIAGEDGTLSGRMKGTRAAGNVKAKTGTIANVRSLSGYLTTTSGERVVFSMIANGFTTPSAVVDAAVEGALERVITAGR